MEWGRRFRGQPGGGLRCLLVHHLPASVALAQPRWAERKPPHRDPSPLRPAPLTFSFLDSATGGGAAEPQPFCGGQRPGSSQGSGGGGGGGHRQQPADDGGAIRGREAYTGVWVWVWVGWGTSAIHLHYPWGSSNAMGAKLRPVPHPLHYTSCNHCPPYAGRKLWDDVSVRLPSSCAGLAAMPPATLITALPHPAHLLSPAFNWCRPWLLCQWHPPTWCLTSCM